MKKVYTYSAAAFVIMGLLLIGILAVVSFDTSFSNNIAMINLDGAIFLKGSDSGLLSTGTTGVEDYIKWLDEVENNDNIKAVIIKINSPGGEVVASEKLSRKIKEVSEKKPVVAYIETIGASGAYMAASSSNYIVAEKQSLVGSIGVRMELLHYYGLMEKLGVNTTSITGGKYKNIGTPNRPMTEEEYKMLESIVDEMYFDFISMVAENRNMTINETLIAADGKIYNGLQAKNAGLIDQVGTEKDAIDMACKFAKISEPRIYEYKKSSSIGFFGMTLNNIATSFGYGFGKGISENMDIKESFKSYKSYEMYY
ncbi:signal peptide peptidase SppA, 36K type [Methanococcus vannielii SB]|uniref:Signal peptide peptidase SppA, 36K type n=1 Tax=Methanococcus vannielii (strain ATCC 35089 / DSM 1224 / JCM 13029 / OCM 148 / SB) TaxID=406327 RepID=A6UP78_METVS|nr:signal peptide peptidase SppA [Methanococcus vannielii]ABR54300.1 signal peptide peptidase SppA, 36K type [Methanococcus vannielii SB]